MFRNILTWLAALVLFSAFLADADALTNGNLQWQPVATTGPAPAGLELRAEPHQDRSWRAAPLAVTPGIAYSFSALVDGKFSHAAATLRLRYLDAAGNPTATFSSAPLFGLQGGRIARVTAIAPPGSVKVEAQLASTAQDPISRGLLRFSHTAASPGIELRAHWQTPRAVWSMGQGNRAEVTVAGVVPGRQVRLDWQIRGLDGGVLAQGSRSSGNQRSLIDLPALAPGYYSLRVTAGGSTMQPSEKQLSFVVLGADAGTHAPRLGLDAGLSLTAAAVRAEATALVLLAGTPALRDRTSWQAGEPAQGDFRLDGQAAAMEEQRAAGLAVGQMYHDTPAWAAGVAALKQVSTLRDPRAAYDYTRRMVQELKPAFVEVWNEPDGEYFVGLPEDYAAVLKAAYLGAKDADPALPVLLASANRPESGFWESVFANNAGAYFDIANLHYYAEPETLLSWLPERYRPLLSRHGLGAKPVWITETGLPQTSSADAAAQEKAQAGYLVRTYASAAAAGVAKVFAFYLQEFLHRDDSLWGLLRADLSPKPAYAAFATLARKLGQAEVVGWEARDQGYAVYFRQPDGRITAVVWGTGVLSLPARGEITDVGGARRVAAGALGLRLVTLEHTPQFIDDVAPIHLERPAVQAAPVLDATPPGAAPSRVWLQAVAPKGPDSLETALIWKSAGVPVDPTAEFRVEARVHNYSARDVVVDLNCDPHAALALVSAAGARLSVPAGQTRAHAFVLRVQKAVAAQPLPVVLRLNSIAGRDTAQSVVQVLASDIPTQQGLSLLQGQGLRALVSANAVATLAPARADPGLSLLTQIHDAGETWTSVQFPVPAGSALSAYQGIEIESTQAVDGNTAVPRIVLHLQAEDGGLWYVASEGREGRYVFPLATATLAPWSANQDSVLNLDRLRNLFIGWGAHPGRAGERQELRLDRLEAVNW